MSRGLAKIPAGDAVARRPARIQSNVRLETQPNLELDHSTRESLRCSTEVTAVGEIGVALATRLKWGQVEHVKDVEEVCPEIKSGGLSQRPEGGELGVLPQCHINLTIDRAPEPVAPNSVVSTYPSGNAIDGEVRADTPRGYVE